MLPRGRTGPGRGVGRAGAVSPFGALPPEVTPFRAGARRCFAAICFMCSSRKGAALPARLLSRRARRSGGALTRTTSRPGSRISTRCTSRLSRLLRRSNAASCAQAASGFSSGSSTSIASSMRRFQRRSPTRTAARDPGGQLGFARQHLDQRGGAGRGIVADDQRQPGEAARIGDRDHLALAVDQLAACRRAATAPAAGARPAGHTASAAGAARSPRSAPRAVFRAALSPASGRPRGSACRAAAASAAMIVAASVVSRPSTSMSSTTRPSEAVAATTRSAASASSAVAIR